MSFGVMGGTMQPQGHLQVVVRIADYGQNPQAACDGSTLPLGAGHGSERRGGLSSRNAGGAARAGPRARHWSSDYNQFGSCQAIWRLEDGYLAASDPRRDGQAVGF